MHTAAVVQIESRYAHCGSLLPSPCLLNHNAISVLVIKPLYIQRLDDAAFTLLASMQFSRQHLWLCPQARTKSWQVACPYVCHKAITAQLVSTSNGSPELLSQRSGLFAGSSSLRQRSTYSSDLHARPVGMRRIVTKAIDAPNFVSDGTTLWQWRKTQLWKIALFTGPALSIPLADPIMSLVDTVCVGQVPEQIVFVTL